MSMLHIDTMYVNLLGSSLRNFKRKNTFEWNFSCPLCGDSSKRKSKARGYIFSAEGGLRYYCHNCHASMQFGSLLEKLNPTMYQEYKFERYKNGASGATAHKVPEVVEEIKTTNIPTSFKLDSYGLIPILDLEPSHPARLYLENRKLPRLDLFHYTENFAHFAIEAINKKYEKLTEDARIVIPFYDTEGNLIAAQGRSLIKDDLIRYITVRRDQQTKIMFGLERLDIKGDTIYITEGPFDSLFLPNAVASAHSDLFGAEKELFRNYEVPHDKVVLVFDNEPRNKQIVKNIQEAIESGARVCLFPPDISGKDLNDMILSGISQERLLSIVQQHTYKGLSALVKFKTWKRV